MTDVENWNADMDAWGLTGHERVHHLRRLYAHHKRLELRAWVRYRRADRLQNWFALAAAVSLAVLLLSAIAGAAP